MKKFIRQESFRHLKLGKKRKKLRIWRRPKGRHSKMRKMRRSYPKSVAIGYKSFQKESGKIRGFKPAMIHNLQELEKLDKDSIAILAKVGAKKKMEIIKHAEERKIKILNIK